MELSATGLALIEQFEGFRAQTYNDLNGNPTIGYGHKLVAGESYPDGITTLQAQLLLETDAQAAEAAVNSLVKVALTQGQFDALVDFTFNLGAGQLASSTLLKMLNAGHYAYAAVQLLRWDIAGGVVEPGLQARRQAELKLWDS